MAKNNEQDPFDAADMPADKPITTSQLLTLLAKMNSESTDRLAQAIIQAQKPYVDPKAEENDRKFRENNRRQRDAQMKAIKDGQASCPHIAGCNPLSESQDMYSRTCIVWHETDATEIVGICTNCQRIFRETDPDYMDWRRKQSINRISRGGNRQWPDARTAKQIARGEIVNV